MFDYIQFSKFHTHNGDDTLPSINLLPESLLVSSIRLPVCFEQSKHRPSMSPAVNICLSLLCYILMVGTFYSTLLPLPGHDSYFPLKLLGLVHCSLPWVSERECSWWCLRNISTRSFKLQITAPPPKKKEIHEIIRPFSRKNLHSKTGRDEKKGKTQEKMGRGSRKRSSSAGSEKVERVGGR